MISIVVQLLYNRHACAKIVAQIDDDLHDPYGVFYHASWGEVRETDTGAFVADEVGDELRGEDAKGGVAAMHGVDDKVDMLTEVEGELEYEGEGGEEGGLAGAKEIRAVLSVIKGDARWIFHFFAQSSYEVEGGLEDREMAFL